MRQHHELRDELLRYRTSNALTRMEIVEAWKNRVHNLPLVIHAADEAIAAYATMAMTSQVLNYADIIHRMENQGWFGIMPDFFKLTEIFNEPDFNGLNEYFEIKIPNLRLKKFLHETPASIWELFRIAQNEILRKEGNAYKFDLSQSDVSRVFPHELFPVQFQGMGALENHAVDRTAADSKGRYRFAYSFGLYLSPGGGMISIQDIPHLSQEGQKKLLQMLNEHLEEEHGNLWIKARTQYQEISTNIFKDTLNHVICNEKLKISDNLRQELQHIIEHADNVTILERMINLIDRELSQSDENKKTLHELRATIQVQTFSLTPLYQEAIQYIQENHIEVEIEQYLDTRTGGKTRQIAHTFLLTNMPLEDWFKNNFNGVKGQFSDDLVGSRGKYLTLLELLARTRDIKFSHIMIPTVHSELALRRGDLQFKSAWKQNQYHLARIMLCAPAYLVDPLRNLIQKIDNLNPAIPKDKELQDKLNEFIYKMAEFKIEQTKSDEEIVAICQNVLHILHTPTDTCVEEITHILHQEEHKRKGDYSNKESKMTKK